MKWIIASLGATIGGYAGWWAGNFVGLFTAYILSILGTAAGLYYARKWAAENLP